MLKKRINCDVFLMPGDEYNGGRISITGNLYAAQNCRIYADIDVEGEIYFEENVMASRIAAKGNVRIKSNAKIHEIKTQGELYLGENSSVWFVVSKDDAFLESNVDISGITTDGNIIAQEKVDLWDVSATGDIEVGDFCSIWEANVGGFIYRNGKNIQIAYAEAIKEETEEE